MVLAHHVQPEVVGDEQAFEQCLALLGMIANCILLCCRGFFPLAGQHVLQRRHGDVHGEGGAHQAVALAGRQLQLLRHDVAQGAAHQCVRCAVAHRGSGGQLEHQVQRGVDVVGHQVLQPAVDLAHLGRKILHPQRRREHDGQRRFQIGPQAQKVFIFAIVALVSGGKSGSHGQQVSGAFPAPSGRWCGSSGTRSESCCPAARRAWTGA